MNLRRPSRTFADYLVIGISPVLIMLLVGSLCFFLIEVFYRGGAVGSVRWVMFWFVLAVVLVARIGIEKSSGHAFVYGLGLAVATWLYLVRIHPAFIVGAILLALVWWCSHKLTWDCTLIDEDEDASGGGLMQSAGDLKQLPRFRNKTEEKAAPAGKEKKAKTQAAPHPPGLWVVWFSVAAIPLFGIGQMLLPGGDQAARHAGFVWLFVYVSAALGLLLTTSFLGLRRYLRQRYLVMPGFIAFGWIRFGVMLAALVLIGALLLPRPGATAAWRTLGYQIDYRLHQASDYAMRFSPHGSGQGRTGNDVDNSAARKNDSDSSGQQKTPGQSPDQVTGKTDQTQNNPPPPTATPSAPALFKWLRALFLLAVLLLTAWLAWRHRAVLLSLVQSIIAALKKFWNDLLGFKWGSGKAAPAGADAKRKSRLFASFQNPFLGGEGSRTPEQLVLYSYAALRAWAEDQGITPHPEQTAREFCAGLVSRFPEITEELRQMAWLYSHAAYDQAIPPGRDLEPVKRLWRFLAG